MLRSFQQLAREPDAAIKAQATNANDAVSWLKQANATLIIPARKANTREVKLYENRANED